MERHPRPTGSRSAGLPATGSVKRRAKRTSTARSLLRGTCLKRVAAWVLVAGLGLPAIALAQSPARTGSSGAPAANVAGGSSVPLDEVVAPMKSSLLQRLGNSETGAQARPTPGHGAAAVVKGEDKLHFGLAPLPPIDVPNDASPSPGATMDPAIGIAPRLAPSGPGGKPRRLSLADAIALALRDNRNVRGAFLQRVADRFGLRVAENQFVPQAEISASANAKYPADKTSPIERSATLTPTFTWLTPTGGTFSFAWDANATPVAGRTGFTSSLGFTFVQPLLRGAGVKVATAPMRIARLDERSSILAVKSTLIDTVDQVIAAYRTFVQAGQQLAVVKRARDQAKAQLQINKALVATGRMAALDLVQSKAEIARDELDVLTASNALDSTRLALLKVLGVDSTLAIRPIPNFNLTDSYLHLDYSHAIRIALNNRVDYLDALLAQKIAAINLTVAKDQQRWQLDAVVSATRTGNVRDNLTGSLSSAASSPTERDIGLSLKIPLGDLSRQKTLVDAQVGVQKARLAVADTRQTIEIAVRNALRDAQITRRQVDIARTALKLAQRQLQVEKLKLNLGRTSIFNVVQFQSELVSAQSSEIDAEISYQNALTHLDSTLGTTLDTWRIVFTP